ncbi:MAG TPA: hypothetical protein VL970_04460 [Candidatus Acidoferrales bacterium]|nr:hypothetical protein [Candidatus Acidoferrales bacterium]
MNQGQTKITIHEPANLQIGVRTMDAAAALQAVIQSGWFSSGSSAPDFQMFFALRNSFATERFGLQKTNI